MSPNGPSSARLASQLPQTHGPLRRTHSNGAGRAAVLRQRGLFAGVELTADQKRRLEELPDARASWRADHEDELNALRQQSAAARQAGDDAALEAARDRILQLSNEAPNARDILEELTPEQREQFEQQHEAGSRAPAGASATSQTPIASGAWSGRGLSFEERRKQRFAGVGLSEDQQRRIAGAGPRATRMARAAQGRAPDAARATTCRRSSGGRHRRPKAQARKQLEELRATSAGDRATVLSELTDEQREQLQAEPARPEEGRECCGVGRDQAEASGCRRPTQRARPYAASCRRAQPSSVTRLSNPVGRPLRYGGAPASSVRAVSRPRFEPLRCPDRAVLAISNARTASA